MIVTPVIVSPTAVGDPVPALHYPVPPCTFSPFFSRFPIFPSYTPWNSRRLRCYACCILHSAFPFSCRVRDHLGAAARPRGRRSRKGRTTEMAKPRATKSAALPLAPRRGTRLLLQRASLPHHPQRPAGPGDPAASRRDPTAGEPRSTCSRSCPARAGPHHPQRRDGLQAGSPARRPRLRADARARQHLRDVDRRACLWLRCGTQAADASRCLRHCPGRATGQRRRS